MSHEIERQLFDIAGGAAYLGLSVSAIRELIYKGKLPTVRWDRRVHLARDDLDAFIERHRKVPEQAAWMEERQEEKRAWLADQEHHRTEQENDGR